MFDTNQWKQQRDEQIERLNAEAEEALAEFAKRRIELEDELANCNKQIDALNAELGKTLPKRVKPKKQIRPVIMNKLENAGDHGEAFDTLADFVAMELQLDQNAVTGAIYRMLKAELITIAPSDEDENRTVRLVKK